jgi:hypothetical protein
MSSLLKDLLSSGRKILVDTKQPPVTKKVTGSTIHTPVEADPHKVFVKRTIAEKPKKADVVEDMKRFCKQAEDAL